MDIENIKKLFWVGMFMIWIPTFIFTYNVKVANIPFTPLFSLGTIVWIAGCIAVMYSFGSLLERMYEGEKGERNHNNHD